LSAPTTSRCAHAAPAPTPPPDPHGTHPLAPLKHAGPNLSACGVTFAHHFRRGSISGGSVPWTIPRRTPCSSAVVWVCLSEGRTASSREGEKRSITPFLFSIKAFVISAPGGFRCANRGTCAGQQRRWISFARCRRWPILCLKVGRHGRPQRHPLLWLHIRGGRGEGLVPKRRPTEAGVP